MKTILNLLSLGIFLTTGVQAKADSFIVANGYGKAPLQRAGEVRKGLCEVMEAYYQ
jgi:hypothetical protein